MTGDLARGHGKGSQVSQGGEGVLANICFGQHLLWSASAGQESGLETGDTLLGNLSGAVIILLKSDLIGDTSVEAPAAPFSRCPVQMEQGCFNINRMRSVDPQRFPMETNVLPCC